MQLYFLVLEMGCSSIELGRQYLCTSGGECLIEFDMCLPFHLVVIDMEVFYISGLFYANIVSCMLMKDSIDMVAFFGFARFFQWI